MELFMKKTLISLSAVLLLTPGSLFSNNTYKDNFYQTVNQTWLASNTIPEEKIEISSFSQIDEKLKDQFQEMMAGFLKKKEPNAEEQMMIDLYLSYTNKAERNKAGISPLLKDLANIEKVNSYEALATIFADLSLKNVNIPYALSVGASLDDPTQYALGISQSGAALPKKYYDNNSSEAQKKIKNLSNYYKDIATLAKFETVDKTVENCMAVEAKLAHLFWTPEKNHEIKNIHNPTTYSKLNTMMSNLDLDGYFKVMDYPEVERLNVYQPSYIEEFNKLFKEIPLPVWKDYLRVHLLMTFAPMLSQGFEDASIKYNISEGLNAKLKPLNVRGVELVSGALSMLFGKYYVKAYFDEKHKEEIIKVVHTITEAYREVLTNSKRLSPATKEKALKKIDEMTFNIGYPNKWLDYTSIKSQKDNLIHNVIEINAFQHKRAVKKLKEKVVDREEWGRSPQEVNAYYNPQNNKFVLLAAILNEPFFDSNGSDAVNYGGIGFIIGHEIGHCFDDMGSQFDEKGRLKNWWTKEDYATFNLLKNKLIAQAEKYEILPGVYANGKIEIGEIIADLSGSEIALKAYLKITDSKKIPRKEALQNFFIQIAKTWRAKYRKQAIVMQNDSDPHPIGEYRTNGTIKNMDTFYEAFDIKKGDPMYIAPEARVHLWPTK